MTPSIGLNLRVTGYCNQGGRKYMEDVFRYVLTYETDWPYFTGGQIRWNKRAGWEDFVYFMKKT